MVRALASVVLAATLSGACAGPPGQREETDAGHGPRPPDGPFFVCGDGVVHQDEVCDDGPDTSDSDPYACQTDCTRCPCDTLVGVECSYAEDQSESKFECGECPPDTFDLYGNAHHC